jgi:hypothetical protein
VENVAHGNPLLSPQPLGIYQCVLPRPYRIREAADFYTVVVGVLAVFDGRALPNLPLNITLNTFLALFTTCCKAAFMVPIAEALSQWKWNIYAGSSRPLFDFQILDVASRGSWGSSMLIWHFKWK